MVIASANTSDAFHLAVSATNVAIRQTCENWSLKKLAKAVDPRTHVLQGQWLLGTHTLSRGFYVRMINQDALQGTVGLIRQSTSATFNVPRLPVKWF